MISENYLFDIAFLEELSKENQRELYVRICALSNDELPLEQIEGKILDGSINIDGKSIIRRTCNLSMIAEDVDINLFYWGLRTKFTLEVGLKNNINKIYPDIVWFKQGLFIITQFNTTQTTNKWEIKISGKDKMCLLNGDISGHLPYEVDFGKQEYHNLDTDTVTYTYVTIKEIIRRAVQEFGGESLNNIIINDIDDEGLILLKYINESPAYLYKEVNTDEYINMVLNGDIPCLYQLKPILTADEYSLIPKKYSYLKDLYINDEYDDNNLYYFDNKKANENKEYQDNLTEDKWFKGTLQDNFNIVYEDLLNTSEFPIEPTIIKFPTNISKNYTLAKIQYGDMPGYYLTDLTYASGDGKSSSNDLIAKAGESITSVLDKVKNMLAHFEYYYDVNGKFIFQKKRNYIITPWNNLDTNDLEYSINLNSSNIMFSFLDSILISSFSNNPKINNIKNDYVVWGSHNVNGIEIPVHMRYALDKKPISYKPIRPLKEEIRIITKKGDDTIDEIVKYKYYDGPEVEPYLNNLTERLKKEESIRGFSNSKTSITIDGYTYITEIYPYFAKEAYNTENTYKIVYDKQNYSNLISKLETEYAKQNIYTDFDTYVEATVEPEIYDKICIKEIVRYGVDWRELIYQMALDYRKLNYDDNFLYYIAESNPQYPTGKTGYEQYYTDLEGFWRSLYDPNPELKYEQIDFNKVKQYAPSPAERDFIYIEDGYRRIKYQDITNALGPTDLYLAISPEEGLLGGIYPYIKSKECCLELGNDYYINENGTLQSHCAITKNDKEYETLNKIDINNIYIKDIELFKDVDKNQYLVLNEFDSDLLDALKVLSERVETKEDIIFRLTSIKFDNLIRTNPYLTNFYLKDKNYLPYNEVESKDYYKSNLKTFAEFAQSFKNAIESLNISNYSKDQKSQYFKDYLEIFRDFILNIQRYNFNDLNDSIFKELQNLEDIYKNDINSFMKNYIGDKVLNENNSCLVKFYSRLHEKFFNSVQVVRTNALSQVAAIENTYNIFWDLVKDVQKNLEQIEAVHNDFVNSSFLELKTITEMIDALVQYKMELQKIKNPFMDGQIDCTVNTIDAQIADLIEILENNGETSGDNKTIKDNITNPIEYLKDFLNLIFIDNTENNILIKLTKQSNYNLYKLIDCIIKLPLLEESDNLSYIEITNIISYVREDDNSTIIPIWSSLLSDITKVSMNQNKCNEILQQYLEDMKDYQEYLVISATDNFNNITGSVIKEKIKYYRSVSNYNKDELVGNFWSIDVDKSPHLLLFWFDFLNTDEGNELSKISIPAIGDRVKVITDNNIHAINYKKIPQIIFKKSTDKDYELKSGYTYININHNTENFFSISSKSKSAKERIEELLYTHSYGAEDITLSSIPIYYLEPNHHILVRDDKSSVNGEYVITKMTIPLNFKKTMNITASRAVSSIT